MQNEAPKKKTAITLLRQMHRDIGFLVIGLTLVYALSGILIVARDTDFLKETSSVVKTLPPGLSGETLAKALKLRHPEIQDSEAGRIAFHEGNTIGNGTYDPQTGATSYTEKKYPLFAQKMISWHHSGPNPVKQAIEVLYSVLLLFLALSPLGMFKPSSPPFKRGVIFCLLGLALATGLMFVF